MSNISKKGEIDYSKGKIYIIRNNQNSKIYIGSTTWNISKMFNEHKRGMIKTRSKEVPLYKAMLELGTDCFYWEEVELYPCDNVSQLQAGEGYWIREYNAWDSEFGYNRRLEQRSRQEYYKDKKESILEKSKQYH